MMFGAHPKYQYLSFEAISAPALKSDNKSHFLFLGTLKVR